LDRLDDLGREVESFINCEGDISSAAQAAPRNLARFGNIRSRIMAAATSLMMPAPLHARRKSTLMIGELGDFSSITLVQTEDIKVNFTSPIAPGSEEENLGKLESVFTVAVCKRSDDDVACPAPDVLGPTTPAGWKDVGTAVWSTAGVYQVNWRTTQAEPVGEYDAFVYRDNNLVTGSAQFSIRNSGSGPSYYTHNAGRTLPIKFFLSALD
jgi:hypothetical protein